MKIDEMELKPIVIKKETSRRMSVMSFLCACMIVAIHCTPGPDKGTWQWWLANMLGGNGLCRIAVPWFFIASGFFLAGHFSDEGWYKTAVLKRVRTLVFPFFVWALIGLAFTFCMWFGIQKYGYSCGVQNPFESGFFVGITRGLGFDLAHINIGPIWYLRMLFILVVFSPILLIALKKFGQLVPMFLLIAYGVYDSFWHFSDFWEYLVSIRGIAYFATGVALRCCSGALFDVVLRRCRLITWLGISLIIAHSIASYFKVGFVANLFDFLMVPPTIVFLWKVTSIIRLPRFCTENAFPLYVMHILFLHTSIVIVVLLGFRPQMGTSITIAICRLVMACLCSIGIAYYLKRICPLLANVLFGGR